MNDKRYVQVGIGELKQNLSAFLNLVRYGNKRIIVTSHGKPKVAIVDMRDYELLEKGE